MKIFPAIDIINGQCVRLTKGDYATKKIYHSNPLDIAKHFVDEGFTDLHIVDLDAARDKGNNLSLVFKIVKETPLKVQLGGGIRNSMLLHKILDQGIDKAIVGSIAVKQPQQVYEWIDLYGSHTIVIGADVKSNKIATDGWYQTSTIEVYDFIKNYIDNGAHQFLCTDVSKDGMMEGIGNNLYDEILNAFPTIKLIASGGVCSIKDVEAAKSSGLYGIVIGKALYENKVSAKELITLMKKPCFQKE